MVIIAPALHSCSPCETKMALLHLLPTSSKVTRGLQSTAALIMDQPLVEVMICTLGTILIKLVDHTASLVTHINSPVIMSITVDKQRTFLLVSIDS